MAKSESWVSGICLWAPGVRSLVECVESLGSGSRFRVSETRKDGEEASHPGLGVRTYLRPFLTFAVGWGQSNQSHNPTPPPHTHPFLTLASLVPQHRPWMGRVLRGRVRDGVRRRGRSVTLRGFGRGGGGWLTESLPGFFAKMGKKEAT